MSASNIKKVFVLMLENRSFDHMLGFSGITGTDSQTGQPTSIQGLKGTESNTYDNQTYTVAQPADFTMPVDPGHEFPDVVDQLCGPHSAYPFGGDYPPIDNSGFVNDYVTSASPDEGKARDNYGEIMKCYSPSQLPVLNALAKSFAVCDNWYSSIPGPTWPNRFFLHAASSGGLDHSPSTSEILEWETVKGFSFPNGHIFNALNKIDPAFGWRIYRGASSPVVGSIPSVSALKGINLMDTNYFDNFAKDIQSGAYAWKYTFIEPNYGDMTDNTYTGGTSQHPMDDVTHGEALIKATYEAIRNSPHWEESMLIITWDEHGGFYDHIAPGKAVAPGDTKPGSTYNTYGFTFQQYGVRVPAVIVSPYIAANIIDHGIYDHASVPATLEKLFGMPPLTARDANASNLLPLLTLDTPRTDTPATLPNPVVSIQPHVIRSDKSDESLNQGNLPGFMAIARKGLDEVPPSPEREELIARYPSLHTRGEANDFLQRAMNLIHRETMRLESLRS